MQSIAMVNFTTSILLFSLLIIALLQLCCCHKAFPNVSCIARERRALLQLRSSLVDKSNRLSSWSGEDCCNWEGVGCSKNTGHVVKLDLSNPILYDMRREFADPEYHANYVANYLNNSLAGEINPSILSLEHLCYLDLSWNNLSGIEIPKFFGLLKKLKYLNLSEAGYRGKIPHDLGNLSRLQNLDLSSTYFYSGFTAKSISWVTKLSSLKSLDLSYVDLSKTQDWFQAINMLPSLLSLKLKRCRPPSLPNLSYINLTSLNLLHLSGNYFNSIIPLWLFNMTSLKHLDLSINHFHGPILLPDSFVALSSLTHFDLSSNSFVGSLPLASLCNLSSLKVLDLSYNKFEGVISSEIGYFRQLIKLDLGSNKLNGTISPNLWLLRKLEYLDITYNSLIGEISEVHFAKLQKLKYLYLSSNALTLNVRSSSIPPFQLQEIEMNSIKIGPQLPSWLRTQKKLYYLGMRNASISDNIPDWFEIVHSHIYQLDLSFNNITGKVPNFKEHSNQPNIPFLGPRWIRLSSNRFEAPPYQFPYDIQRLFLSNNIMAGPIPLPEDLSQFVSWNFLYLDGNYFNGSIPESICHIRTLKILDLSNNQLSGRLPLCLGNLQHLFFLNLANNSLSGQIPSSLGYIELLQSLHLNNNKFQGELPLSLQYLKYMQFLDLGENELEGIIPSWIGKHLSNMRILRLQSNKFYGDISLHLCQLSNLQVLNLARNNLTGRIPNCFNNFSVMGLNNSQLEQFLYHGDRSMRCPYPYVERLVSSMSGREVEFSKSLPYLTSLDLSQNHIVGGIPKELMDLVGLRSLNLSGNRLSGKITEKIGNLRNLQSLDLSRNELFGLIPPSLANLNFLSSLNLSSNKLYGRIPTGNQLQTLNDPSIYAGNNGLCGQPLPNSCTDDNSSKENGITLGHEIGEEASFSWFYAGLGPGFGVGFAGTFSILLLKKSWRCAYFQLVENVAKDICIWIALKTSNFKGTSSNRDKT